MIINPHFWVVLLEPRNELDLMVGCFGNPDEIRRFDSFVAADEAGKDFIENHGYDAYYVLGPTWKEIDV